MPAFEINGSHVQVDADPDTPLLWVLRDELGLVGAKFGCGAALCGACTVLVDGIAQRACVLPVEAVQGRHVTTIEAEANPLIAALVDAWVEVDVAQCGYCQPGQVMAAAALLASSPHPTDAEIDQAMSGNLCRCGAYPRIRTAVKLAAKRQGR